MDENNETLTSAQESSPGLQRVEDAKPVADPSPAATPDAKGSPDPSPEQGAKKPATLAEVVRQAAESPTTKSTEQSVPKTEPAPAEAAKDETVQAKPAKPGEQQQDVPFHTHPRWQEKVAQVRELNDKVAVLETRAKTVDELMSYTGGEQGFENAKALMRAYSQDPATAVGMLETLLSDARNRAGLVLQSDDLRKRVDEGLLDEASALEIEQSRKVKSNHEQVEQQRRVDQVRQTQQAMVTALNSWEANIRSNEPDYNVLAEDVQDRLTRLATLTPPRTPEDAIKLAVQALADVKKRNAARMPKAPAIKPGPVDNSSRTAVPAPKTLEEVVRMAARGGRR
jgi:hypothetical protein